VLGLCTPGLLINVGQRYVYYPLYYFTTCDFGLPLLRFIRIRLGFILSSKRWRIGNDRLYRRFEPYLHINIYARLFTVDDAAINRARGILEHLESITGTLDTVRAKQHSTRPRPEPMAIHCAGQLLVQDLSLYHFCPDDHNKHAKDQLSLNEVISDWKKVAKRGNCDRNAFPDVRNIDDWDVCTLRWMCSTCSEGQAFLLECVTYPFGEQSHEVCSNVCLSRAEATRYRSIDLGIQVRFRRPVSSSHPWSLHRYGLPPMGSLLQARAELRHDILQRGDSGEGLFLQSEALLDHAET
jgi:hypothetical protein